MSPVDRRSFLLGSVATGVGTAFAFSTRAGAAAATQQAVTVPMALRTAPKLSRVYDALDGAGLVTHSVTLTVTLPVPTAGGVTSSCWLGQVKLSNMLPNPAIGFAGGTYVQNIKGQDSVATYLMALDTARAYLEASTEEQIGTVVWKDVPQAASYGLPVGAPNLPCSAPAILSAFTQSAVAVSNPRYMHPCDDLSTVALLRDLVRTDDNGTRTKVRLMYGLPRPCQGPLPQLISYVATFQVQGLQPAAGTLWPDGVVTRTGHGVDPICALMGAMVKSAGLLLNTSEGANVGNLQWPLDPSDRTWGLPRFDPNDIASDADMAAFLATLPPDQLSLMKQLLAMDWDAYYS